MMHHLCITVTFFDPLFHGKGDADEPEWPPSPMRLFQALVAGSRTGCRQRDWSEEIAEAFRWLEGRGAPQIVSSEARPATTYELFVPNNDGDKKFDRQDRLTTKTARPHWLLGFDGESGSRPTLHYLWPIPEDEWLTARPHAELLCREARHLMALGWGIDQAVGIGRILTNVEAEALPGQRWRPWRPQSSEQRTWRVPTQESLEDLQRVHTSFVNRTKRSFYDPPIRLRRFDSVVYLRSVTMPPRPCAKFELPEGVSFRQEKVNEVAAMLRSLACRTEHRRDFQEQFNEDTDVYLAGHANGETRTPARFSYLPLPTIGHEHADGLIRRLLIAEPYGGDGSHARWAQDRLRNASLRDNSGNERGVLLDLWRGSSRGVINRYVGESRVWSTVTPVVLPGFDDGKLAKAERLCLEALAHADLPIDAAEELTFRRAPYWPGSLHPCQYHRPSYLRHLPVWHVHLVFREPVPGPLAVGAGRHCGLGIFAATE